MTFGGIELHGLLKPNNLKSKKRAEKVFRIGGICLVKLDADGIVFAANYSEATKLHGKSNLITSNLFDRVDSMAWPGMRIHIVYRLHYIFLYI